MVHLNARVLPNATGVKLAVKDHGLKAATYFLHSKTKCCLENMLLLSLSPVYITSPVTWKMLKLTKYFLEFSFHHKSLN
jgi:hypothetical protein